MSSIEAAWDTYPCRFTTGQRGRDALVDLVRDPCKVQLDHVSEFWVTAQQTVDRVDQEHV